MRKVETKEPIQEIEAILESLEYFYKIDIDRVQNIEEVKNFPSVCIKTEGTKNELNGAMTNNGCEYDRIILMNLYVNLEVQDKYEIYDVYDKIETAILGDSKLWNVVLDRDIIGSEWDDSKYYPKRQGIITLALKFRSSI